MAWECAECNIREGAPAEYGQVVIEAVCHHCGKPLCRQDRVHVVDDEFGAPAFHCRECRQRHHSRAVRVDGQPE